MGHDVQPVRIGVIGCGSISTHYLQAAHDYPVLDMIACADIDHAAAERLGAEFGCKRWASRHCSRATTSRRSST